LEFFNFFSYPFRSRSVPGAPLLTPILCWEVTRISRDSVLCIFPHFMPECLPTLPPFAPQVMHSLSQSVLSPLAGIDGLETPNFLWCSSEVLLPYPHPFGVVFFYPLNPPFSLTSIPRMFCALFLNFFFPCVRCVLCVFSCRIESFTIFVILVSLPLSALVVRRHVGILFRPYRSFSPALYFCFKQHSPSPFFCRFPLFAHSSQDFRGFTCLLQTNFLLRALFRSVFVVRALPVFSF